MQNLVEILVNIFSRVIIIYIGIFAGFIFIKSPLAKYRKHFIDITIFAFTPLLIFVSFLGIDLTDNLAYPIVGGVLVTIIGIFGPGILSRIAKANPPTPAEICTATFPNALNFPFPIIFAFAPESLGIASLFLGVTTIARNSIGFWISGSKMDKQSIRQILLFPPLWAIVLGIVVRLFNPNLSSLVSESSIVDPFFQLGIFATLMTVGFSVKMPSMTYKLPILRTGTIRFFVMGILSFGIVIIFRTPFAVAIPFIVQSIAPPAVYNTLYAEKLKLDVEMTSQIIITLTFIGLILVPFEILLIQLVA